MRPERWQPPVELSAAEQAIVKRIRRAKLFIFLRWHRHELFDETLQEEIAATYEESEAGQPPIPRAIGAGGTATVLRGKSWFIVTLRAARQSVQAHEFEAGRIWHDHTSSV